MQLTSSAVILRPQAHRGYCRQARHALSMLRRKKGATVPQLASAIDWQTRGAWTAISRVRQLGYEVVSTKRKTGERVYKIAA
jgi:hypothetical protein